MMMWKRLSNGEARIGELKVTDTIWVVSAVCSKTSLSKSAGAGLFSNCFIAVSLLGMKCEDLSLSLSLVDLCYAYIVR